MDTLKKTLLAMVGVTILGLTWALFGNADTSEKSRTTFIVDRTGERWDITQAVSMGFKAGGFQFGIGRNAILPLNDSGLQKPAGNIDADVRVIGVENGTEAHAYVVRRLTRHEIANTQLGKTPIAAAY